MEEDKARRATMADIESAKRCEEAQWEAQKRKMEEFDKQHRRREMFEKVALAEIATGDGFNLDSIADMTERLLARADKFAKGE